MTTITGGETARPVPAAARPKLALLPVLALAGAAVALLLALSARYGYFGDELYFIAAGRHLDWGYADQPPLLPLVALAMDTLFPGSLTALRAPAALAFGAGAVVAAMLARELGADRRAQFYTSAAYVLGFLALSRNLNTVGFDILLWTVLTWLLVRWVRTHTEGTADDRLLLWSGVVVAVSIQVKFQIAVFVVLLLVMLAAFGPREVLRRPMLWGGALIAAITTTPTLLWQAANGWPQFEMGSAVSAEMNFIGGPLVNAGLMILIFGPVFGIVVGFYGWWRLLSAVELRPYRFLGWTAVAVTVVFLLLNGRSYYIAGLLPVLWAAGAVGFQRRREAASAAGRRSWSWVAWPALLTTAAVALPQLPFAPAESLAGTKPEAINFQLDEIGWPKLASDVGEIHHSLPPQEQQDAVILTSAYWSASAMEFYGDQHDLPEAYSGSRGYWFFGQPPASATTVIHIGPIDPSVAKYFTEVRQVGAIDNGLDIQNLSQGNPIYVADIADGVDWNRAWPDFKRIGMVE